MCEPIHVELPCSFDAAGLAGFLEARGLRVTVKSCEEQCELEVGFAVDPDVRLHQEVEAALSAWLAEGDHALVPSLDRRHEYVLRPPGD